MPATYAHYRLGEEVKRNVGEKEKKIIEAYPELYSIGLHGPDILFYYNPLKSNEVNRTGYGMHDKTGREFFERAAKVIKKSGGKEAYLSYIYGFICHFALDVSCHGYIDEKIERSGISHSEIETELDRELMIIDGLDPVSHRPTGHIVPSGRNASVIRHFFGGITKEQVEKALKGMRFYLNFLVAPSKLKRNLIYSALKLTGNSSGMKGLIVNYEKNPDCIDSTGRLIELFEDAKTLAVRLLDEYDDYLDDEKPLDKIYEYTFGGQLLKTGE